MGERNTSTTSPAPWAIILPAVTMLVGTIVGAAIPSLTDPAAARAERRDKYEVELRESRLKAYSAFLREADAAADARTVAWACVIRAPRGRPDNAAYDACALRLRDADDVVRQLANAVDALDLYGSAKARRLATEILDALTAEDVKAGTTPGRPAERDGLRVDYGDFDGGLAQPYPALRVQFRSLICPEVSLVPEDGCADVENFA